MAGHEAKGIADHADSARNRFFRLLSTGATEGITIEKVGFGHVQAIMTKDGVLLVLRHSIHNIERIRGQGSLIHAAFEQAAIDVARASGATSVRVGVGTTINQKWIADLRSLDYDFETIPTATGFTRVLIRTLPL